MCQVVRHDRRCAAVKRKWAHHHPPVAEGDQLFQATLTILYQQFHRVAAVGWRFPIRLRLA